MSVFWRRPELSFEGLFDGATAMRMPFEPQLYPIPVFPSCKTTLSAVICDCFAYLPLSASARQRFWKRFI